MIPDKPSGHASKTLPNICSSLLPLVIMVISIELESKDYNIYCKLWIWSEALFGCPWPALPAFWGLSQSVWINLKLLYKGFFFPISIPNHTDILYLLVFWHLINLIVLLSTSETQEMSKHHLVNATRCQNYERRNRILQVLLGLAHWLVANEQEKKNIIFTPNTLESYKILQKLSPKHAAHGVAQSPYPIYRHRKACLSKQLPGVQPRTLA